MAVIGTEIAGKSSILDAWFKCDLLLNDPIRCTYTTTDIRSCSKIA